MGTKRVGLARTQALVENLKRSLDWNGATLTDCIINTSQNLTCEGTTTLANTYVDGTLAGSTIFRNAATVGQDGESGPTNLTDASGLELATNTVYQCTGGVGVNYTLPSAGDGAKGDFISIYVSTNFGNGETFKFTCHADDYNYASGSLATRVGGAVTSKSAISVKQNDTLTITGHTNGDGGSGTRINFVNTSGGTNGWACDAVTLNCGGGGQAGTIAFG